MTPADKAELKKLARLRKLATVAEQLARVIALGGLPDAPSVSGTAKYAKATWKVTIEQSRLVIEVAREF
jgi:hypothetical protein